MGADIPKWSIAQNDKASGGQPETLDIKWADVAAGKMKAAFEKNKVEEIEVTPFKLGATEVTYRQWKQVYFWALDKGYVFDRDGDMGSMDFKRYFNDHTPDEPVTDIGYYDMMVWCNALSEMQGKTMMFYSDKEKTKPYKSALRYRSHEYRNIDHLVIKERKTLKLADIPLVYMKWDQEGYRLPTQAEWQHAHSGGTKGEFPWGGEMGNANQGVGEYAWYLGNSDHRTHEVAKKKPNGFGLFDMDGNAIEYVQDGAYKGNGKFQRGQTKNPVSYATAAGFDDHSRFQAVRNGFMYDDFVGFENASLNETEIWAGTFLNQGYPDMGFRVALIPKGVYHPDGVDPDAKPPFATPLDLNR